MNATVEKTAVSAVPVENAMAPSLRAVVRRIHDRMADERKRQRRFLRNPLGHLLGGPIGFDDLSSRDLRDPLKMALMRSLMRPIMRKLMRPHMSDLPVENAVRVTSKTSGSASLSIPSWATGCKIYFDGIDLEAYPHGWHYFTVTTGGNTYTGPVVWRQGYTFQGLTPGSTFAITVTTNDGTQIAVSFTLSWMTPPSTFQGVGASPVTGTITPDQGTIDDPVAVITRIKLPANAQTIALDWTAQAVRQTVLIGEVHRGNSLPAQAVVLIPGQKSYVLCRYREVAIWCPNQISLPVEAPSGSVLDTTTARQVATREHLFTQIGTTVVVTSAAELTAALANIAVNNKIVLDTNGDTGRTFAMTSLTVDVPATGLLITTNHATKDKTKAKITGDVYFRCSDATRRLHLMHHTYEHTTRSAAYNTLTGVPAGFAIIYGIIVLENCNFDRVAGASTQDTAFSWDARNTASTLWAINCRASGAAANRVNDLWQFFSASSSAYGCTVTCIGLTADLAGDQSADNVFTGHNYMKIWCWGGTFTKPGNGPGIGHGNIEVLSYFIGTSLRRSGGAYSCQVGISNNKPLQTCFGCHFSDIEKDNGMGAVGFICCHLGVVSGGVFYTYYYPSSSLDYLWSVIGCFVVEQGSGSCIGFRFDTPRWFFAGNQVRGLNMSVHVAGSNSASNQQDMLCNDMTQLSAFSRLTQTGIADVVFNLLEDPLNPSADSTTKNLVYDGNHAAGGHETVMASETKRNSITPIRNATAAITNFTRSTTPSRPATNSNMAWEGYVAIGSTLSGPNQTTLRSRLAISFGLISPMGDAVVHSPLQADIGAASANRVISGFGLYPGVYTA